MKLAFERYRRLFRYSDVRRVALSLIVFYRRQGLSSTALETVERTVTILEKARNGLTKPEDQIRHTLWSAEIYKAGAELTLAGRPASPKMALNTRTTCGAEPSARRPGARRD